MSHPKFQLRESERGWAVFVKLADGLTREQAEAFLPTLHIVKPLPTTRLSTVNPAPSPGAYIMVPT